MDMMNKQNLNELFQLQSFKGKPIINIMNGEEIGVVDDVLIHPDSMSLAAVLISKGNILRQDLYAVQNQDIKVWGKDTVLVSGIDLLHKKKQVSELGNTVSASDAIRGREIISLGGERNGELKDFLVDQDGRLQGIEVGRVSESLAEQMAIKNRFDSVRLPISAIHSMGKDVIIIDLDKVERAVGGPVMEYPVEDQPVEDHVEDELLEKPE